MPQTVAAKPVSDYAPRRANAVGSEAVAEAVSPAVSRYVAERYTPPPIQSTHTTAIREAIKKLTHREMREMVVMIFKAHKEKDENNDAILRDEMADVLDAFAHGE
jgi:hypothetical protein